MPTREAPSSGCLGACNEPVEVPSCSSPVTFAGCGFSGSEGLAGCGSGASAIKSQQLLIWVLDFPRLRTRNRQTPEMSVTSITAQPSVRETIQEIGLQKKTRTAIRSVFSKRTQILVPKNKMLEVKGIFGATFAP